MHRTTVQVLASCASAIEFYDFMVYSFFATYIGQHFFPNSSNLAALLNALAVFGAGFAARPVGAMVLGSYADRQGRRAAMVLTMTLISFATLTLALLPTYQHIGILAPILLVLCRVTQGFAMGGEVGAATAYLLEASAAGKKGRAVSWFLAGQGAAIFTAGVIGTLLTVCLSAVQMAAWGWRLPFLLSIVLAPLALYLRRLMPETALPLRRHSRATAGLLQTMRDRRVLLLIVALAGGVVASSICSYLTTFAIAMLSLPAWVALSATLVVGTATFAGALIGGWLSDRVGTRPVLLWSRLVCTASAVPAFVVLVKFPSQACLCSVAALLTLTNAINGGALFAPFAESFHHDQRAACVSLWYALALALFGGTSQLVVTGLIERTSIQLMPGWYLLLTGTLALAALFCLPEAGVRHSDHAGHRA